MRPVLLFLTALVGLSFSQPVQAQSFNCAIVRGADEIAVCRNPRLSRLDEQANFLYRRLRNELGPRGANRLTHDRNLWLQHRARCGANPYCLEQVYRSRIDELRGYRRRW